MTLNTKNNNKLSELLRKSFKRSVIWNQYQSKIQTVEAGDAVHNIGHKKVLLDSRFQGVNRLFVMGFDNNTVKRNTDNLQSHRRYFLPRVEVKDYNVLIDGRNFYDQNINDSITRYNELLKLTTGKSEDYTTGCLIDYDYYVKDWRIVVVNLSHQSVLDSDPKAIQQIGFIYKLENNANAQILTILEKEKETVLEFNKGTVKIY